MKVKLKDLKKNGVYHFIEKDLVMVGFGWNPHVNKDGEYFRAFHVCEISGVVSVFACDKSSTNEIFYIGEL